jgi:hypothetical protein
MKNFKKKVALLLVMVMALSLFPMSVFSRAVFPVTTTPSIEVAGVLTLSEFTVELDMAQLRNVSIPADGIDVLFELGGAGDDYLHFASGDAWGNPVTSITTGAAYALSLTRVSNQVAILNINSSTLTVVPSTANEIISVTFPAVVRQEAANGHLTVREPVNGIAFNNLNQRRLANFPTPGVRFSTDGTATFNEVLLVHGLRIHEQSAGQFMYRGGGNNTLAIRLEQPQHYAWTDARLLNARDMSVVRQGDFGPTVASSRFVRHGNFMYVFVTFNTPTTPAERMAGAIEIRGLTLVPTGFAPPTGQVSIPVRVANQGPAGNETSPPNSATAVVGGGRATTANENAYVELGGWPYNADAWRGSVVVGTRTNVVTGIGAVALTRVNENPANIRSGASNPSGSNWTVTLRFTESVRGAWDSGVQLSTLNLAVPSGVRIHEAQTRFGTAQDWGLAFASWAVPSGHHFDWATVGTAAISAGAIFGTVYEATLQSNNSNLAMVLPRADGVPGLGAPRVLEVRMRLEASPGYEMRTGGEINVTASGTATAAIGDSNTVLVANAVDPVVVSLNGPLGLVTATDNLGLMHTAPISEILITETAAGRLSVGQAIEIRLPLNAGFVPPALSAPTISVEGVNGFTTLATSGRSEIRENNVVVGWSIPINAASTGDNPGVIRIRGLNMNGSIINSTAFDYNIRVAGPALNAAGSGATGSYLLQVITFDAVENNNESPGNGTEEPGNGNVLTVPTQTINPRILSSAGVPAARVEDGVTWINLRYMLEEVWEGSVDFIHGVRIFSAPHATNGTITVIEHDTATDVWTIEVNNVIRSRAFAEFSTHGTGAMHTTVAGFERLFGVLVDLG